MTQELAIEMYVSGVVLDPKTQAPVVVLKDETGDVVVPIWIGIAEATAIAATLKQVQMSRPLTHDLIHVILHEVRGRVQRAVITELKESTYYSEVVISIGERAIILDARPSDAIAIALRENAPIYVTEAVIQQSRVTFQSGALPNPVPNPTMAEGSNEEEDDDSDSGKPQDFKNIDKEKWKDILEDLDPEDFKYKA